MKAFEKWAKEKELEFANFVSNREKHGFYNRFDDYLETGNIKSVYNEYLEHYNNRSEKRGSKRNHKAFFLACIIAKSFYPEEFEYYMSNFKFRIGGVFDAEDSYMKSIDSYLKDDYSKRTEMLLTRPSQTKDTGFYWIEICSGLQANFAVFKSYKELNDFITNINELFIPKSFQNYGLYLREIEGMCLVFSILHGYSLEEAKSLINKCKDILNDKKAYCQAEALSAATLTQETEDMFDKFLKIKSLESIHKSIPFSDYKHFVVKREPELEEEFIEIIRKNSNYFMPVKDKHAAHWSTVKSILMLLNKLEHTNSPLSKFNTDKDWIQNNMRDLQDRLAEISDNFNAYIVDLYSDEIDINNGLRSYIVKRLKEGKIQTSPNDALRCMYIVAIMKDISIYGIDTGEVCLNSWEALKEINCRLEKAFLRKIDCRLKSGQVYATTSDLFDWFIIELIKFDEDKAEEFENVSGFKYFEKYILNDYSEEYGYGE